MKGPPLKGLDGLGLFKVLVFAATGLVALLVLRELVLIGIYLAGFGLIAACVISADLLLSRLPYKHPGDQGAPTRPRRLKKTRPSNVVDFPSI